MKKPASVSGRMHELLSSHPACPPPPVCQLMLCAAKPADRSQFLHKGPCRPPSPRAFSFLFNTIAFVDCGRVSIHLLPLKISPESPEGLVCKPVFCSVAAPPLARSRPELESYSRQAALLPSGQKVCKRQWRQLRDYWGNSGQSTSTCKDEHKVYSPSGEARS